MPTGFEVAGLALAIFPIVVQGLSFYLDGARKIKDFKDYKRPLKRLVRQIGMEQTKFENTCETLLERTVSTEHMATLVSGVGWQEPEFQKILGERLRPKTIRAFVEAVDALTTSLEELGDKLGVDEENQPALLDKKTQRRQWKKIKLILQQDDYGASLNDIKSINSDLAQLVAQPTPAIAVQTHKRQSLAANKYNHIRCQAKSLYDIFLKKLCTTICSCQVPHNTGIRLQNVAVGETDEGDLRLKVFFDYVPQTANAAKPDWCTLDFEPVSSQQSIEKEDDASIESTEETPKLDSPTVQISFSPNLESGGRFSRIGDALWGSALIGSMVAHTGESIGKERRRKAKRDVSFKLPNHPTPPRTHQQPTAADIPAKRIEDLCATIKEHTICKGSNSCIGILVDDCNGWCHRIWPQATSTYYLADAISLDKLLTPGRLEKRVRFQLGTQIASAIMQLHDSAWLDKSWGKRDIFFLQRAVSRNTVTGEVALIREPVMDQPFVRQTFGTSETFYPLQQPTLPRSTLIQCDKTLFSLGIILMELWFERPIEDLRSPHQIQNADGQDKDTTDFETAQHRIGELSTQASEDYGFAVWRCINGLNSAIGIKGATFERNLLSEEFKNEVHANVICLLEKNLKEFTGTYC